MKKLQIILWGAVGIAMIGFIAMSLPKKNNKLPEIMPIAGFNKGVHFTLIAHTGQPFNTKTELQKDEYALIFFGFTHCPVICPTELQKFSSIMDGLPDKIADKIHPLFVTIDPERDDVSALQSYVPMFHEKIIGLSGDVGVVHQVLNDWKVYFTKVDDPAYTEYTMDHSTYSYLVDSDMNILAIYRMKNTDTQIIDHIQKIVK